MSEQVDYEQDHARLTVTLEDLREYVAELHRIDPETVTDVPTLIAANRRLNLSHELVTRENAELHRANQQLRADLDYVQRQTRRLAWIATNVASRVQENINLGSPR